MLPPYGALPPEQRNMLRFFFLSPEFAAMWRDHDVRTSGEGVNHIRHPTLGPIAFEHSAFAVDGRPDLILGVYHPTTPATADAIRAAVASVQEAPPAL